MALTSAKTGYNATLKLDAGSAIAKMTDVRVELSQDLVDVQGLDATMIEREVGLWDWRMTASRNYASMAFLDAAKTAMSAGASVGVAIINPGASSTSFSGAGYITRGALNYPVGATNEELEVTSKGTDPVIAAD